MSLGVLKFLQATLGRYSAPWEADAVQAASQLQPPDRIFGGREELLRGDAHFIWARWFLESVCDPSQFVSHKRDPYALIFSQTVQQLRLLLTGTPDDEIGLFASPIAKMVWAEVRNRQQVGREPISLAERQRLIDEAGGEARCWVCGYQFTKAAIQRFLKEGEGGPSLKPLIFVDYMTQRGKNIRHLLIEADHVLPVAAGGAGGANLRLACGWCNAHKGDNLSLYDQAFHPMQVRHPALGIVTVPRPFWVVRLLAYRKRCEWQGGCSRTTSNAELFVAARRHGGAMNPANLMITCEEHDPIKAHRLVNPSRLEMLES
jgi:hypothetical protein